MMCRNLLHPTLFILAIASTLACGDAPVEESQTEAPGVPEGLSASDGEDPDAVSVTWEGSDDAEYYRVLRDDAEIARVDNTGTSPLTFLDTDALPAEELQAPSDLSVAIVDDRYELTFAAASAAPGVSHSYSVIAGNEGGESEASEPDEGFRAGPPIADYEVDIDGTESWSSTDGSLTFRDEVSEVPVLSASEVDVSRGEFSDRVVLEAEAPTFVPGDAPTYRVRALTEDGHISEASAPLATPSFAAEDLLWQWERSDADDPDATFEPVSVSCANALLCDDTTAPEFEARYYRGVASIEGLEPVSSSAVRGWRSDCNPDASPFGGGSGEADAPYTLCTLAHILNIGNQSSEHFKLSASIDLSSGEGPPGYIDAFGGVFDGSGHALLGYSAASGFFSRITSEGVVRNLVMEDALVTTGDSNLSTGILTNVNEGTITSVRVQGELRVRAPTFLGSEAGGIAGDNRPGGVITDAHAQLEVVSASETPATSLDLVLGGIAGGNQGQILDSSSHGDTSQRLRYHGGLVGWNYSQGRIIRSFSTAHVDATEAGGLVARLDESALLEDVYATGEVRGLTAGGLVGRMENGSSITRAYATGEVIGTGTYVGGLTARHDDDVVVENAYWDPVTTTQVTSVGGTALSTVEFAVEDNFESWLFTPADDAVWVMSIDGNGKPRPKLAWEQ